MRIKSATLSNLDQLAECHISAFPDSLSSALGKRYVKKMLEWYLVNKNAFLFYVEAEEVVVGYCGGLLKTNLSTMGSASGMAQHSFNEGIISFLWRPWLLLHREMRKKYKFVLKNIVFKIRGNSKQNRVQQDENFTPYAALVVIGVKKQFQGKGYGNFLLNAFEEKVLSMGLKKMLLTVKADNELAIRSYIRGGWKKEEEKNGALTMAKIMAI